MVYAFFSKLFRCSSCTFKFKTYEAWVFKAHEGSGWDLWLRLVAKTESPLVLSLPGTMPPFGKQWLSMWEWAKGALNLELKGTCTRSGPKKEHPYNLEECYLWIGIGGIPVMWYINELMWFSVLFIPAMWKLGWFLKHFKLTKLCWFCGQSYPKEAQEEGLIKKILDFLLIRICRNLKNDKFEK